MKKIFPFIILAFFMQYSLFFSSCCCKKKTATQNTSTTQVKIDFEKEGYVKATVIYSEIDACKYLLQLEPVPNGPDVLVRLEPTALKEEFRKDELQVWIKYAEKKGAVSICMAGKIVELSDIQLRK